MEKSQTNRSERELEQWMKIAIEAAVKGIADEESPFGAIIIGQDGAPAAIECNRVKSTLDPSAHAEVLAITAACKAQSRLDLSDCLLEFMLATGSQFQIYGPVLELDCAALLLNHPANQS